MREGAAESNAGQGRGNFAGDAANFGRSGELGVEGFDLRRSALQKEQHDRFAGEGAFACASLGARGEQVGKGETSPAQGSHFEQLPARPTLAVAIGLTVEDGNHGKPSGRPTVVALERG